MFVKFESLVSSSKVWIYQSNREFTANEVNEISEVLKDFVGSWKRHSKDLKASYQSRYSLTGSSYPGKCLIIGEEIFVV